MTKIIFIFASLFEIGKEEMRRILMGILLVLLMGCSKEENTPTEIFELSIGPKVDLGFKGDNGKVLYWATHNVGATLPEERGGLYGWADTTGNKTSLNPDDYLSENYSSSICGDVKYDIARAKWGGTWRLPSTNEQQKLLDSCTFERVIYKGAIGGKFTSKINGNSIFLPAAGFRHGQQLKQQQNGYYWSGSLVSNDSPFVYYHFFNDCRTYWYYNSHFRGQSVRPVSE